MSDLVFAKWVPEKDQWLAKRISKVEFTEKAYVEAAMRAYRAMSARLKAEKL